MPMQTDSLYHLLHYKFIGFKDDSWVSVSLLPRFRFHIIKHGLDHLIGIKLSLESGILDTVKVRLRIEWIRH